MLLGPLELHGEEDIEDNSEDDNGEGIIIDDDDVEEAEFWLPWPIKDEAANASIPEEEDAAAILSNLELAMLITLGGRWLV